ncbi:MAG: 4Fe-4S binding protein [candidate division Zixibacteria bacterium]|nr:4Fe-4S binding protein [candidate division Zixibacteria bacterium]MDD5425586.1 4Fe-4S binding protein [candidate division Zixibacteria bacterium]
MTESVYNKRESRPGTRKIDRTRLKRNHDKPGQRYRFLIQSAFSLLCLWLGVEFYFFIRYLETNGASGWTYRPPGVEGFLPISSLMSLYHFFISGEIHPAHPAGLVILVAILLVSLLFGKAFCSWLCPVGFISELLGHISRVVFKRNLKLPGILDYPLRGIKYLLLGFFIYSIFFLMTPPALEAFLGSPYNLVADIKMYYFFAEISQTALLVIGGLLLLSLIFRNFWCRYLCPYGALLGILALLSPNRIKRNAPNCIDCGRCARVCPSFIKVDKVKTVISDECTTCLQCVEVCPVKETLEYQSLLTRRPFPVKKVALGVVLLFIVITGMGMVTGLWRNNITTDEYLHHQKYLKSYSHPTGTGEIMDYNQRAGSGEAKSKPWEKETDNE